MWISSAGARSERSEIVNGEPLAVPALDGTALGGLGEGAVEGQGDGFVELWEQVAVAVEGDVDGGVAHPGLDRLRMCAGGDGQGDARVAEIVEAARHAGSSSRLGDVARSEERRVGKEGVSTGRYRGVP